MAIVVSGIFAGACQRTVELEPINFGRASLGIIWGRDPQHLSPKDSAKVRIYDNEADFYASGGRFVAERSLADRHPVDSRVISNLEPKTYWIKVFNASTYQRSIEHNLNSGFKTPIVLQEHTYNEVNVETETVIVNQFAIRSVTIHALPSAQAYLRPDRSVRILFFRWSSGYPYQQELHFDERVLGSLPWTIDGLDIPVLDDNSWWYDPSIYFEIYTSNPLSYYDRYDIKLFDLLNSNTSLNGQFHFWDNESRLIYSLNGEFTFQGGQ